VWGISSLELILRYLSRVISCSADGSFSGLRCLKVWGNWRKFLGKWFTTPPPFVAKNCPDACVTNALSSEKVNGDTSNLYFDFFTRSLSKQDSVPLASSYFYPSLGKPEKMSSYRACFGKNPHRTKSILLYLCTFQVRSTGCLPLLASSNFVCAFMIRSAFQRARKTIVPNTEKKYSLEKEWQTLAPQKTYVVT